MCCAMKVLFKIASCHTWLDSKDRGKSATYLIAEYHCGRLQSTPLGKLCTDASPGPPFKTILELVLWNGLQSCHCITPDVIKMPSFQYLRTEKSHWGLDPVNRQGFRTQLFV